MKSTIQDKIKTIEKQIRICNIISIAALVITILLLVTEYCVVKFFPEAEWRRNIIKICIYALYVLPFVICIPLFFRINLKGKVYRLNREQEHRDVNERKERMK